ncbi:8365_t:CDS:2 [Entrophospora sp. SA101]|nr:8365_t:CDS:2 [Entrophospora sp. SA101]
MSTRKRTSLSAAQKRELCEAKKNNPSLSNVELARQYNIGKATVTDILSEKERWLAITIEQDNLKKFRGPKALFVQNRIKAYDDFQDGTTDKLADYTDEEKDLEMLLEKLPNSNNLSANEYIHVEDENVWTDLTDEDIIEMVNQEEQSSEEEVESMEEIEIISNKVAKESVDTVLKYLYQQGPEFGEVGEEVKILRGLNRRIGLVIQKNLKQTDLNHYFEDKMIE